jgi:hypothetical protein
MKTKNNLQTLIILLLCICVLGFFANWAQNEYGLKLVGISLFGISLCFASLAFLFLQHKPGLRILLLFFYSCLLFTTFFNASNLPSFVFIIAALLGIFGPQLFIPLVIALSESKTTNKTPLFEYSCATFLACFCLGNYFKIHQLTGAAILVSSSGFIIFPVLYAVVILMRKELMSKSIPASAKIFLLLFIATNILGYIFLTQHWPGAKIMVGISLSQLILLLVSLLLMKLKNINLTEWWASQIWILRLSLICLAITSTHYILRKNKLAPAIYSSEFPKALEALWEKSNSITKEGLENDKKADAYYQNYSNFLNNREAKELNK